MRSAILVGVVAVAILPLSSCADSDAGESALLDELRGDLAAASVSLQEAIAIAEAESPEATVVSAQLVWIGEVTNYDIDLLEGEEVLELDIAAADGSILARRRRMPGAAEGLALQSAASLVGDSAGWDVAIDVAELSVSGTAFEAKSVFDGGRLAIDVLAADGIWVVSSLPDGTDLTSQRIALSDWEGTDPGRPSEAEELP